MSYIVPVNKIYLDTSVFGGYYDLEFELWTHVLFEQIQQGAFKVLYSQLTDIELLRAPSNVKELVQLIPKQHMIAVNITDEATELAEQYISEKVVGQASRADCIHIALATLYHADILVSWNFKHIVNVNRIRGYNAVNYKLGHQLLEIRTPREIIDYEDHG